MASIPPPIPAPDVENRIQRLILENMQEAVVSFGLDHRIQTWSSGAERIYGWGAEEAVGRNICELTRPEIRPEAFDALLRKLFAEGRGFETNQRRRKNGSTIVIEATYLLVKDEGGVPNCVLCVSRDVTELAEARQRSLDRARLEGLETRINEAEFVVRRDGTIVHVNDRAAQMYGLSREELLTRNAWGLRAKTWSREAESTVEAAWSAGLRFESLHRREDGSTFPVEVSARRFEVGGEAYLHALIRDLTDAKHAEHELQAAHFKLTRHLSNTPLAVVEWDGDYRVTAFSPRAEEILGWPAGDVLGKRVDEVPWVPEEDWPLVREAMRGMDTRTQPDNVTANRNLRKDGSLIHCEWYNSALHDEAGALESVLSLVHDVTARHEARARLSASEARLSRVLAGSHEGLFDWDLASGQVTRNDHALELLGLAAGDVATTVEGWLSRLHPEDRPKLSDALQEVADGRRSALEVEFRALHKDGSWRWLLGRASRVPGAGAGGGATVSGTVSDVTERRRLHELLRESERRLALVLEGTSDGFWDCDLRTGHVWYSESWARMLGFDRSEIDPTLAGWQRLIHPNDLERVNEAVAAHVAGVTPAYLCEHRVRRKDGTWAWVKGRGKVVERAPDGTPVRATGSHTDITARKESEELLQASSKAKEQLVQDLRKALHEVKTLSGLLPICMYCKNVRNDHGYWEQIELYLGERSAAEFSHGVCPDCAAKRFPGVT